MSVIVLTPVKERHKELLRKTFTNEEFVFETNNTVTEEQFKNAEIVFGQPSSDKIKKYENIKWVQLPSAGYDPYIGKGIRKDLYFSCSVGAYSLVLAEYALGAIFILQRKFNLFGKNQAKHIWKDRGPVQSVEQSKALIIGLGHAGSLLATKLNALGCKTDGIKRNTNVKIPGVDNIFSPEMLNSVIGNYNIIVITVPGSPETTHMINEKNLKLCRPDTIIVNVGRGYEIDNMALYEAIKEKRIYGCALDVTEPEPLPSNHPLWDEDNAIITPHIAGGMQLESTVDNVVDIFIKNLAHYRAGEKLINRIEVF